MPLSDEDKALFRSYMKSLQSHQPNAKERTTSPSTYYLSDYYTDPVQPDTTLDFKLPDVPEKRFRELKKGLIRWEARLDLHGLQSDAAREMLCKFMDYAFSNHYRCLLIIHGKGSPSGKAPVLKNLVNHWLKQIDNIIAFHSALPRDGGTGAVYVLLKRDKNS